MTAADVRENRLQLVLDDVHVDMRQPINAVYYQSASMSGRTRAFLDFLAGRLTL